MFRITVVFIALVFCISCNTSEKSGGSELVFDRLVGTWKLGEEDQYEQWKKNEDGTYASKMFAVVGADTNIMEEIKIVNEGGKWNFITLVKGQNKGKAVTFTSTIFKDTLVQFENPSHDFPRMINYRVVDQNTMQAFIAGTSDTIYFNFSRVVGR